MTSDPDRHPDATPDATPDEGPLEDAARRRRIRRRFVIGIVVFALALPTGVCGYLWFFLRNTLPPRAGRVEVPGITAEVTIRRDALDVPQIFAENRADAYYALGWTHASDRLYQMEMLRRLAAGRISQLLGPVGLASDTEALTLGHRRRAREQVERLDPETKRLLEAYVAGVNAYLPRTGRRPIEFKVLRAPYDPWSVEEVLAVLDWHTWTVDRMLADDDVRLEMFERSGRAAAEAARVAYPVGAPTTAALGRPSRLAAASSFAYASNAFAVAAEKSASGGALLACDPHADVTMLPGIWYLAGMHVAETGERVFGATTPGMPFVLMGTTGKAAYGFTAAGIDLVDHYVETVDPDDPSRYLGPEGSRLFEMLEVELPVKNEREPRTLTVRSTRHGPVLRNLGDDGKAVVAVRWAGLDADLAAAASSMMALPHAEDFESFRRHATSLGAANLNWLRVDATGSIGYQLGAPLPIREGFDGSVPVDGRDAAADWRGYRPFEERPFADRPDRGWLANCNNAPARPAGGVPLSGVFVADRIRRAVERLDELERPGPISIDDLEDLQLDRVDAMLRGWRTEAAAALERLGEDAAAAELRDWDGALREDSRPAAWMALFRHRLMAVVFGDEAGRRGTLRMLRAVFDDPASPLWDDVGTPEPETREDRLDEAMRFAIEGAAGRTLGEVQSVTLAHPFRAARGAWFLGLTRGPFPRGGSPGSLDASFSELDAGADTGEPGDEAREAAEAAETAALEVRVAPSLRLLVDLAEPDVCRVVLPGGQSGHPASDHFFDFHDLWSSGELHEVSLDPARVEAEADATLVLAP